MFKDPLGFWGFGVIPICVLFFSFGKKNPTKLFEPFGQGVESAEFGPAARNDQD
jgi:hypothetical protein